MEMNKYSSTAIQQARNLACSKYSTPEQQYSALRFLSLYHLLTEAVLESARRARYQRWIDLCSFVIRQKERELSEEWFNLRLHHETEAELPEWIAGKVVCDVQDETLVINLDGRDVSLMKKDVAESLLFESLDGTFRLRYAADTNAMVIDQLVPNPKTYRRIRSSSHQLLS